MQALARYYNPTFSHLPYLHVIFCDGPLITRGLLKCAMSSANKSPARPALRSLSVQDYRLTTNFDHAFP